MTSAEIAALQTRVGELEENTTQIWILISSFLIFYMHTGFTMLEAGSVRQKNETNLLLKNVGAIVISGITYYVCGFAFAFGNTSNNGFIGSGQFALSKTPNSEKAFFLFQLFMAATSATIMSGAIAGRASIDVYYVCVVGISGFIYPVVTHWAWSEQGWLSPFAEPKDRVGHNTDDDICGYIDFAGSGCVHIVGGMAALMGAWLIGSRTGRFEVPEAFEQSNTALIAIGVLILWFGWFGFNAGSTLDLLGDIAAKAAVATTLSPCAAGLTGLLYTRLVRNKWEIGKTLNCVLSGLVSITAGCPFVADWASIIIGIVGALVYLVASHCIELAHIDDPVDAISIHGMCGIWGCLAVGIFGIKEDIQAFYPKCPNAKGNSTGMQFAIQLLGVVMIISWTVAMMGIILCTCKLLFGTLRITVEEEQYGMDQTEHMDESNHGRKPTNNQYESNSSMKILNLTKPKDHERVSRPLSHMHTHFSKAEEPAKASQPVLILPQQHQPNGGIVSSGHLPNTDSPDEETKGGGRKSNNTNRQEMSSEYDMKQISKPGIDASQDGKVEPNGLPSSTLTL